MRIPGGTGGKRRAVVALAAAILTMAFVSLVVAGAVRDGMAARGGARGPVDVTAQGCSEPALRYSFQAQLLGERQTWVMYVEPSNQAVLPPGLSAWPGPGQAAVSPALAALLAGKPSPYGQIVDTIGPAGLMTNSELFAYVVPENGIADAEQFQAACGFATMGRSQFGDLASTPPLWHFTTLLVVLWLVPALAFLYVACGVANAQNLRRWVVLETLGVPPARLWVTALRPLVAPVLAGCGVTAGLVTAAMFFDIPLPGTGFVLWSQDVRTAVGSLVATVLAAAVAAVGLSAVAVRPRRLADTTRPRLQAVRYPAWKPVLCGLAVVATASMATAKATSMQSDALLYLGGGLIVALALATPTAGWLLKEAAAIVTMLGRRTGRASLLVAGRMIANQLRAGARVAGRTAAVVLVVYMAGVWLVFNSAPLAQAEHLRSLIGDRFATIRTTGDVATLERVRTVLAGTYELAHLHLEVSSFGSLKQTLHLTSEQVTQLGLANQGSLTCRTCDTATQAMFDHLQSAASIELDIGTDTFRNFTSAGAQTLLVWAKDSGSIDLSELSARLAQVSAPAWRAETTGQVWLAGAARLARDAAWIGYLGVVGGVLVVLTTMLRSWEVGAMTIRKTARLAFLSASRNPAAAVAGIVTVLPVLVGVGIGAICSWQYSFGLVGISGAVASGATAWTIGAVLAASVILAWVHARTHARAPVKFGEDLA